MALPALAIVLLELVEYGPLIAAGVNGAVEAFMAGADKARELRDENRDPTPEEWTELRETREQLRMKLHSDES